MGRGEGGREKGKDRCFKFDVRSMRTREMNGRSTIRRTHLLTFQLGLLQFHPPIAIDCPRLVELIRQSMRERKGEGLMFQIRAKIPRLVRSQGDLVEEVLRVPAKSSFKHLNLETPLWTYSMSSSLKSPPKGLKVSKCEKGKSGARPPIPYVPPTDLIEK